MRTLLRPAAAGMTVCLLLSLLTAGTTSSTTTARVLEVATADWPTGEHTQMARMSADGNVVAVESTATLPATRPGSSGGHVYVIDLGASAIEQINVDSAENGKISNAWPGGLSADGRYVTFTNYEFSGYGHAVAFLRDRVDGTTEQISYADSLGVNGFVPQGDVDVSDDGRYVVYASYASNLIPFPATDTNGKLDVFVYDRVLATTTRVSVGPGGLESDGDSSGVSISADGSTILFTSTATNLLATPDTNGSYDVFVVDRATLAVERVSVSSLEVEGDSHSGGCGGDLSADGSVVAFSSQATNLAPDNNWNADVFVRDRVAGTTVKASVADGGVEGPAVGAAAYAPVISADGTSVAYASRIPLVPEDTTPWVDAYLTHLNGASTTTEMLSRTPGNLAGENPSGDCVNGPGVAIDASGEVVAFASSSDDLVPAAADGGDGDLLISRPAPVDGDGDGITDDIDVVPGVASMAFDDGSTFGQITFVPAGFTVSISDSLNSAWGVHIEVTGSGIQKVFLFMCGTFTQRFSAGTDTDLDCGSVIVHNAPGSPPVETVFGDETAVVSIPGGVEAEVDTTPGGGFTVDNVSGGSVTVTVDGTPTTVGPGGSLLGNAWDFDGFKAPVDNGSILNKAKAGKAVALRWRIVDASGQPVTNLTTAHLSVASLACPLGATADQIEEYTTGASGLINDGQGSYHLNWQTPASYAGSCKTLRLDIGDGVLHTALFQFTK